MPCLGGVLIEERAAQQKDEPDEAGASDGASQVILVLDGHPSMTEMIAVRAHQARSASGVIRPITARDQPAELAKRASDCEAMLTRALALATKRSSRSNQRLRALYASAVVRGRAPRLKIKASVITFSASPFTGGLHQFWGWHQVEALTERELASWISLALRSEVRRQLRGE
jgi:hypothetical protein